MTQKNSLKAANINIEHSILFHTMFYMCPVVCDISKLCAQIKESLNLAIFQEKTYKEDILTFIYILFDKGQN